jgi:hypothetical protein
MIYKVHTGATHGVNDQLFTVYCAWPGTPRGMYDEEVDVLVEGRRRANMAEVRRVAQAYLDETCAPGGRVKRVHKAW